MFDPHRFSIFTLYYTVFFRLFEHAEQRSFLPPIMMIEHDFTCPNKKTDLYKNYFQKIGGLSVVHPARKTKKQKFIYLFIAPLNKKHCGTAQERWMKLDPTLTAFVVRRLPLLFSSCGTTLRPHGSCQSCICWQARYISPGSN